MKENNPTTERYPLDPESIDRISERIGAFLKDAGAERSEILQNRLAAECCLAIWSEMPGQDCVCSLKTGSDFGRGYLVLEVPGPMVDPSSPDIAANAEGRWTQTVIDNTGLLSAIGFVPEYRYFGGKNILKIRASAPRTGKAWLKTAISAAVCVLAVLLRLLCPDAAKTVFDYAVDPVYSVFIRMLSAICGPFVLLSIVTSICGMGNKRAFGLIGSVVVRRFVTVSFALVAVSGAVLTCFFPVEWFGGNSFGSGIRSILRIIVEIVPSDIVSPFAEGNALQIVFIAVILGFSVILLSESVSGLSDLVFQLHRVVLQIMHFIGKLMPYFMVTAILKLLLSSSPAQLLAVLKPVLFIWLGYLFMIAVETLLVAIRTKTPLWILLKSTVSASVIGLTTSSSTAAMDKMIENCTDRLGVSAPVTNFAIPLGQVIFKPAAAFSFFACALFIAQTAGITINPEFLLVDLIVSWVLGTSMAPVAGAMVSCMSILFLQLGIPQEHIAVGVSISLLLDNIGTMTSVQLLQEEVFAVQHICRSDR